MTREIPLTQGKVALVDDGDYEELSKYKWYANRGGSTWYAHTHTRQGNRKRVFVAMHRLIIDAPKDMQVDHIDRNGLNNTRANLRLATRAQNGHNSIRSVTKKTSAYKGVFPAGKKWWARIYFNGKCIRLGTFEREADAALAYNEAARKYHQEFACLNDVGPQPEPAPRIAPWVETYGLSAPFGKCQCGCGRDAQVAKRTIRRLGYLLGLSMRYAIGHKGLPGRIET